MEIPSLKPWHARANTLPFLPGGKGALLGNIRGALESMPVVYDATSGDTHRLYGELATLGLIYNNQSTWELTSEAAYWLSSQDNFFLTLLIHSNVKYFGEIIHALERYDTIAALLEYARMRYDLNWHSSSQIGRRINWLEALGVIETWGQRIVLQALGKQLRPCISLPCPERIDPPEAHKSLMAIEGLAVLDRESLPSRRRMIGYIPRGKQVHGARSPKGSKATVFEALRRVTDILSTRTHVDDFVRQCWEILRIKPSSVSQTIHTLKHMELISQVGPAHYVIGEAAADLLREGGEQEFLWHLHARYRFVCEILLFLDRDATPGDLARAAKEYYDLQWPSHESEIRGRLEFLESAGLVRRTDWRRYEVTDLGRRARERVPLEATLRNRDAPQGHLEELEVPKGATEVADTVASLKSALREHAVQPSKSREFELAIADALRYLGFTTQHMGGPSATDVVATARLPKGDNYAISADGKTASSGCVAEGSVKFDALKDHQKHHGTDHVVVIGPDFDQRIKRWAPNNGIRLMTVEELSSLLDEHREAPRTLGELRSCFDSSGSLEGISSEPVPARRRLHRASQVLRLVEDEATTDLPIDDGWISGENLQFALRGLGVSPADADIGEIVTLLRHPLLSAITVGKDGRVRLLDAPSNVALRLEALARLVRSVN